MDGSAHIKNAPNAAEPPETDVLLPAGPMAFEFPDPNLAARYTDWELDFRQIEPGPMKTVIRVLPDPEVAFAYISMSHGVHQQGLSPPGYVTFGVLLDQRLQTWCGSEMDGITGISFGSAADFESVGLGKHEGLTISIDERFLDRVCDACALPRPDALMAQSHGLMPDTGGHIRELARLGLSYLKDGAPEFDWLKKHEFVTQLALTVANRPVHQDCSSNARRQRALRLAIDRMEASPDEPFSILEMCADLSIASRTLQRAFREEFGIGPKAYFNRLRLARVRSELIGGDLSDKIIDAANAYGFWHMGQFAKDYQAMYGELPSETARYGPEGSSAT